MRKLVIATFLSLLFGCQSVTSTSGTKNVEYGDSYASVLKKVSQNNRIEKQTPDEIVAYGIWEVTNSCRKKVFLFFGKKELQMTSYEVAKENECGREQ